MLRASSLGSSASQSPSSAQGTQTQNQPWLSSGNQGKAPLPSPSIRPHSTPQSLQQRPQITQQQHNMPTTSHKQMINSIQQVAQPSASGQQLEHHGQQLPSSRIQPPSSHQQQLTKSPGLGVQRPPLGMAQSGALQSRALLKTATLESGQVSHRVVSKLSIQELVPDRPSEKFDLEVEDILVDLAEDFVKSITTFGCSLAKHRKSTTLEAKDTLLHLERNWNMTIPGFGGDEIRTYKKPLISDNHREPLATQIKKSVVTPAGQTGGKGHMAKAPSTIIGSPPKPKLREAA